MAPVTAVGLLGEAKRLAHEKVSQPAEGYSSWTKFRARQMAFSEGFRVEWRGVTIEVTNDLPSYMQIEEYFFNGHGRIDPQEPVFYGYLIARCEARTEENALSQMLDATDTFMAIFNMNELWGSGRSVGGEHRAEGKLWSGHIFFYSAMRLSWVITQFGLIPISAKKAGTCCRPK
jgi:hypothetical protein